MQPTCHGAGAAMGPAGATVLGDVLVAGGAHVVDIVDVPPVPRLWQVVHRKELMRPRRRPVKPSHTNTDKGVGG